MSASWRELITAEMSAHGETWADVASCTLDDTGLDRKFRDGYGSEEGAHFTLWTERRVYFPACYDGSEWVASASRNPDGVAMRHVGG